MKPKLTRAQEAVFVRLVCGQTLARYPDGVYGRPWVWTDGLHDGAANPRRATVDALVAKGVVEIISLGTRRGEVALLTDEGKALVRQIWPALADVRGIP